MSAALKASSKIGCVAAALVLASSHSMAFDPLRAGFDRMLADEPVAAQPAAIAAAPADPLVAAIVLPLRDGVWPPHAVTGDAVAESFARMLQHEPSRHVPPLPDAAAADPLIAAVVWPLLRSNAYTVARATPQ